MALQRIYPTGNGAATGWTIAGTAPPGAAYLCVSDLFGFADDDSGYLKRLDSQAAHTFTIEPRGIPAGSGIVAVHFYMRAKRTVAGAVSIAPRILIDGAQQTVHVFPVTTSWADYTWPLTTHPITGLTWTVAQVNGTATSQNWTGIGINGSGLSAGEEGDVTQLHAGVEYNPPGGGAGSVVARAASVYRRQRVVV